MHPLILRSGEEGASSGVGLSGRAAKLTVGNPARAAAPAAPAADPEGATQTPPRSVRAALPRDEPCRQRRASPGRLLLQPASRIRAGKAPSAPAMPGNTSGDKDASRHPLTLPSPALHRRAASSSLQGRGAEGTRPSLSVPELRQGTHPQNSAAPELRYSPSHTPGPALLPPAATSYPPELPTGEAAARELWLSPTYIPVVSQISASWGCPGSAPTLWRAQRCTVRSAHLLPRAKPVHPSAPVTRHRAALEDKPGRGERPPPRSPPASSGSRPPS